MKSVIEDLYYGNICPITQINQYREEDKKTYHNFDSFAQSLGAEKEKVFEELMSAQLEIQSYQRKEAFTKGFRLGVRLISEALLENNTKEEQQ